jgi:hypothetical protein
MAFWFFLVIASYFFLWIVTGDMDTLNPSVLGLIGISAGTALGSAFVDAAKPPSTSPSGNQPIVDAIRNRSGFGSLADGLVTGAVQKAAPRYCTSSESGSMRLVSPVVTNMIVRRAEAAERRPQRLEAKTAPCRKRS